MESDFVISVASPSDIALKKGVLLLNRAARERGKTKTILPQIAQMNADREI
jgi:hypothetical protein